jgi:hypothetical protein
LSFQWVVAGPVKRAAGFRQAGDAISDSTPSRERIQNIAMLFRVSFSLRPGDGPPRELEREVVTETAYGAARRAWWSMTDGQRRRPVSVRVVADAGGVSVWAIDGIRWIERLTAAAA